MPRIEEGHSVLFSFDIIRPTGWFDKASRPIIDKLVDWIHELPEVDSRIWVKLVESDFCNGCSEHVADIPPAKSNEWEKEENYWLHLLLS